MNLLKRVCGFFGRLMMRLFGFLVWFLPFAGFFVLLAVLVLPWAVNRVVLPEVFERMGLEHTSVRVQDIGFFSTGLGPTVIGERRGNPVRAENIRFHYDPFALVRALWNHEPLPLDGIDISGILLSATLSDSGLIPDSTEWPVILALLNQQGAAQTEVREPDSALKSFPVALKRVRLANSLVRVKSGERLLWASAEAVAESPDGNLLRSQRIRAKLMLQENELSLQIHPDSSGCSMTFDFKGNLADLRTFLPDDRAIRIGGRVSASGTFSLVKDGQRWIPGDFRCQGRIPGLMTVLRRNEESVLSVRQLKDSPFVFEAVRETGKQLVLKAGPLRTTVPVRSVSTFELKLSHTEGDFSGTSADVSGEILSLIDGKITALPAFNMGAGIPVRTVLSGKLSTGGNIIFSKSETLAPIALAYPPLRIETQKALKVEGEAKFGKTQPFRWNAKVYPEAFVKVWADSASVNIEKFMLTADNEHVPLEWKLKTGLKALLPGKMNAETEVFELNGHLSSKGILHGEMACAKLDASHPDAQIRNLSLKLPLCWPFDPDQPPENGFLRVPEADLAGQKIGSVESVIAQSGKRLSFKGHFMTPFLNGATVNLKGETGLFEQVGGQEQFAADLKVELPETAVPDSMRFDGLLPVLAGFEGGGKLAFSARIPFQLKGEKMNASVSLTNGTLRNHLMGISVEGVDVKLNLEEGLKGFRSPSGQMFKVKKLDAGTLQVQNFDTLFRLEESGEIGVEGISFDFAGGTVRSLSMRVKPGVNRYSIVLHCDRLLLREIFKQANLNSFVTMTGDVRMSGLIPLEIDGSDIRLGEGYLYTAPGTSGHFQLNTGAEMLGNLTPDQPGYGQLELSRMALSNFKYDWIKLNLAMESDSGYTDFSNQRYVLKLAFFGKPAQPLPFAYNPVDGSFVKLEGQLTGQGIMQEMQLDMNLKSDVKLLSIAFGLNKFLDELRQNMKNPLRKHQK